MKMIPTFGLTSRFFIPSMRLLPGRSGISKVRSSSSCTKPGTSPLGEQSERMAVGGGEHEEGRCGDEGSPDLGDVVGFLGGDSGQRLGIDLGEIVQRADSVSIVKVCCVHVMFSFGCIGNPTRRFMT